MHDINQGTVPTKKLRRGARRKHPFRELEVGEFFFIPGKSKNTMSPYASEQGKILERKFRTRLVYMRESIEGWKECTEATAGAILGVGVWRVE